MNNTSVCQDLSNPTIGSLLFVDSSRDIFRSFVDFLHLITGQTMDVCGGLSLYNNYMKGYQNMDSLFEKMLADKAAKEAAGNSK